MNNRTSVFAKQKYEEHQKTRKPNNKQRIYALLDPATRPQGATNYEISKELGILLQTVCAERHNLVRKGLLVVLDRIRENEYGNACAIFVRKDHPEAREKNGERTILHSSGNSNSLFEETE